LLTGLSAPSCPAPPSVSSRRRRSPPRTCYRAP
jgi:hypothetical protein